MTACSDIEEVDLQNQLAGGGVQLTGRIAWNASGDDAETSTSYPADFGIGATENDLVYASNLRYTLNKGAFTPTGEALDYPSSGIAQLFAYAPYCDNINNTDIEFSVVTDQQKSDPEESDLLWSSQEISKNDGTHSLKFAHKFAKVILGLKPRSGVLPSDTKVRLLGVKQGAVLNIQDGTLRDVDNSEGDITTRKIDVSHHEAIIPPQLIGSKFDFVEVTGGGRLYKMKIAAPKKLQSNTIHRFDVDVKNESQNLPHVVTLKYNKNKLGNTLSVPAMAQQGSLDMSAIPSGVSLSLKLRNASGGDSWVKIDHDYSYIRDEIWDGRTECLLTFDENPGVERSIYLEFYDKNQPKDVYHYMCVTQAPAAGYLTFSQESLATDIYGNEYDVPLKLSVKSNRSWSITNIPDWMDVSYISGQRIQDVKITVQENKTGAPRKANLDFIQDGIVVKSFPVSQSITSSKTFTLKYEFDFEFNTRNNLFFDKGLRLYANEVSVFNSVGAGDAIAKIKSNNKYGFVVDAPNSANKLIVTDFANTDYFIVRNYNGSPQTIKSGDANVVNRSVPFFRQIKIGRLNIPGGVRRDQKVKFKVVINNLISSATHDAPIVTATIVDQK